MLATPTGPNGRVIERDIHRLMREGAPETVVFFENQRIYDKSEEFHEGGVPEEAYEITIGDTDLIRSGSDITILTIGATLYWAVEAADILQEQYGMSAEIINLHSLVPLDYTRIIQSVEKTGKVVLVTDACARGSFMDDVARNITDLCFDSLDAPPAVVGAQNWITPPFEFDAECFPQASWILDAIHQRIQPLVDYVPEKSYTDAELIRKAKQGV